MDFQDVRFEQKSVKEVFVEMKKVSELMVDLAYTSFFNNDKVLAGEVLELEEKIDRLEYDARMSTMLSVRNVKDAENISPIMAVLGAIEDIGDGAGDIAKSVLEGEEIPLVIRDVVSTGLQHIISIKADKHGFENKYLGDIFGEDVEILTVQRNGEWVVNPVFKKVLENDVIVVKGSQTELNEYISETVAPEKKDTSKEFEELIDLLIRMKGLCELSLELSFNAVISNDEFIAEEVVRLEETIDSMLSKIQELVLINANTFDNPRCLKSVLTLSFALEIITDASLEISEVVLRGMNVHPVFHDAIKEVGGFIVRREAEKTDVLSKFVKDNESVLAVKKSDYEGKKWELSPEKDFLVDKGDLIILKPR